MCNCQNYWRDQYDNSVLVVRSLFGSGWLIGLCLLLLLHSTFWSLFYHQSPPKNTQHELVLVAPRPLLWPIFHVACIVPWSAVECRSCQINIQCSQSVCNRELIRTVDHHSWCAVDTNSVPASQLQFIVYSCATSHTLAVAKSPAPVRYSIPSFNQRPNPSRSCDIVSRREEKTFSVEEECN